MLPMGSVASGTSDGGFLSRTTINPEWRPLQAMKEQRRSVASARFASSNGDVPPCNRSCGGCGHKARSGSRSGFPSLSWGRRRRSERWGLDFQCRPLQTSVMGHIQRSRTQKRPKSAIAAVPQNVDMPSTPLKKKKKPKLTHKGPAKSNYTKRPLEPIFKAPGNGLLVKRLIPIAHEVLEAKAIVAKGVDVLLKASTVWTCRFCTDVHVGLRGHAMQTCQGSRNNLRHSLHDWVTATTTDVLVPVEAYHLADRLALPIAHDERYDVPRISAVDELCIQAGVDVPGYPTRRYSKSIQPRRRDGRRDATWMGVEFAHLVQQQRSLEPEETSSTRDKGVPSSQSENGLDDDDIDREAFAQSEKECAREEEGTPLLELTAEDDLKTVAEKTLHAWEGMRKRVKMLRSKYRVVVCGYCPEVHVGPKGHRTQSCGAFKHQWRNGQHGWQSASVDDLIPPQYVWHVRDRNGPPFQSALRRFYGKTPAVVEICIQAGAEVPDCHKPLMRLDVVIPNVDELEYVI